MKELFELYIKYVVAHRKMAPDTYVDMTEKDMVAYIKKNLKVLSLEKYFINKKLAGFCTYYIAKVPYTKIKNMYICDFAIDKPYQGKGNGKKLMNQMLAIANKNKCKNINLNVYCKNNRALNFYYMFDFENVSIQLRKEL
jgi:ribosomal protein S18 acetylase RimI-like enzyme